MRKTMPDGDITFTVGFINGKILAYLIIKRDLAFVNKLHHKCSCQPFATACDRGGSPGVEFSEFTLINKRIGPNHCHNITAQQLLVFLNKRIEITELLCSYFFRCFFCLGETGLKE